MENPCPSCSPTCGAEEPSVRIVGAAAQRVYSWAFHEGWTYDELVGEHGLAMSEGRLTLSDGRTLAWREYGPPEGRPLLRFQGMPGRGTHDIRTRGPTIASGFA